jgi:hypothetical protein
LCVFPSPPYFLSPSYPWIFPFSPISVCVPTFHLSSTFTSLYLTS